MDYTKGGLHQGWIAPKVDYTKVDTLTPGSDGTLGVKRQATVTLADRLMVTDMEVILSAMLFPVPKYSGTNANQITHVVYMVNPAERYLKAYVQYHRNH